MCVGGEKMERIFSTIANILVGLAIGGAVAVWLGYIVLPYLLNIAIKLLL